MMQELLYNPFYPLTKPLLHALLNAGHTWFVRQAFPRGLVNQHDPLVKQVFIVSHYNDLHQAEAHFAALAKDRWTAFYDARNAGERERLLKTVEPYANYRFYSNTASPDWRRKLERFEPMYRAYIEDVLGWKAAGKETIYINMYSQFGDVFATIKYKTEKVKLRLSDIENHHACATTSASPLRLNWSQSIYLV